MAEKKAQDKWVNIRFSPDEHADVRIAAATAGMAMGPWLRSVALAAVGALKTAAGNGGSDGD